MKEKKLWGNEWIQVFELDDWYTIYRHGGTNSGVAVLAMKGDEVLVRHENCLPHGGFVDTSITGTIEEGDDPLYTAVKELREESGYDVSPEKFVDLGWIYPSKASDMKMYLYAVEITDEPQGDLEGDGTKGEEGASVKWVSREEACFNKSPNVASMMMRYEMKNKNLSEASKIKVSGEDDVIDTVKVKSIVKKKAKSGRDVFIATDGKKHFMSYKKNAPFFEIDSDHPMVVEKKAMLKRKSPLGEKRVSGKVLWTSPKHGNGIVVDEKGNEYYIDSSSVKDFAKLKMKTPVSFEPARLKPDNILIARGLQMESKKESKMINHGKRLENLKKISSLFEGYKKEQ